MLNKLTKGNLHKFIAIVMTVCMLFTSTASALYAKDIDSWESKINTELWEAMAEKSEDDLMIISLWLQRIDESIITNALVNENAMNPVIYEDPARFEKEVATGITRQLEEQLGYEAANVKDEHGMSLVDWAISNKADEYLMAYRRVVERENSAVTAKFIADNADTIIGKQREILYLGSYIPNIKLEATKGEIEAYAKQEYVESIYLYVELPLINELSIELGQIGADSTTGTKSGFYNSGTGFKGAGVTIGIIEVPGHYASNAPHLSSIHGTQLKCLDANGNVISPPAGGDDHASLVTSIIVGQPVTVGGVTYEGGVAPSATVFQTSINTFTELQAAIDMLVRKGCSVINLSAGWDTGDYYHSLDQEIDWLLVGAKVTIIKSAGNNAGGQGTGTNNITSPGKALNVITVGNAETKSNLTTPSSLYPYAMRSSSSFNQAYYLPNKPDISAPGAWIAALKSTNPVTFYYQNHTGGPSGTSFAAPLVTGVVAQMMQASPGLKNSPLAVKAHLVWGANGDISTTGNNTSGNPYLRERSGAGLLNAPKAVYAARLNGGIGTYTNINYLTWTFASPGYCYAYQTIRVVLVFEKRNAGFITSASSTRDNINIYLKDSSGNIVASSTSLYNNVEIIEYTPTSAGVYSIQVDAIELVQPSANLYYYLTYG